MIKIQRLFFSSGNYNIVTLSKHYSVSLSIPNSLTHWINQLCVWGRGYLFADQWQTSVWESLFENSHLCDSYVDAQKRALKTKITHFTHLI